MTEGWQGDDYLILFDESEDSEVENRYGLSKLLPGYRVVGLLGWDDFIVRDSANHTYSVPAVPLDAQYLQPYSFPQSANLMPDPRFLGKIKWYVQPIAFGGESDSSKNLAWVTHEQHSELVRHWNKLCRDLRGNNVSK